MSGQPRLDLIVAGGESIGLGHVMRSAVLATHAHRRGWRVRTFLEGDAVATRRWQMASGQASAGRWSDWNPLDAAPLTLFDHPYGKASWLALLAGSATKTIVLDDPRYRDRATLSICPGLHHPDRDEADEAGHRTLSGPRFAILADAHRSVTASPLLGRTRLLLSIGGADPRRMTPRLAPLLASVLEDSEVLHGIESRHVVLGPAFLDPGDRVRRSLDRSGWQVHRALDAVRMARLMSRSRIAVMGFGTSLTELAWHGTPHLFVTHHEADDPPARSLERRGIGIHLGSARSLDDATVRARFRRALEDTKWQQESADRAFRAIEGGHGTERILDRLEILLHPTERSSRRVRESGASYVLSS